MRVSCGKIGIGWVAAPDSCLCTQEPLCVTQESEADTIVLCAGDRVWYLANDGAAV
jgi:hypothetical protein